MKRTIVTGVAMLVVFGLGMIVGGAKIQTVGAVSAIAAPVPAALAVPVPARCPNIHGAVESLRSAETELREGRHDFCGHKVEAMRTVHEAIEQLRQAENCAKCRD